MDQATINAIIGIVPSTLAAIAAIIAARRSGKASSDVQDVSAEIKKLMEKDVIMSQALVELIDKDENIMRILMKHLRNRKVHFRG